MGQNLLGIHAWIYIIVLLLHRIFKIYLSYLQPFSHPSTVTHDWDADLTY